MGSLRLVDNGAIWTAGIPNGWQLVPLKYVVTKLNRIPNEDDPVLICTNKGIVIPRNEGNPGLISLTNAGYQGVEPGDLLIHGMDTWHGAIAVSDIRGQCTSVVHVCDSTQDKRFIAYYLRALAFRGVYKAFSNGVRQNTSDFRSWVKAGEIPLILPSFEKQRRIADYLDSNCAEIDEAIQSAESSLAEAKDYRKSLIAEEVMGRHLDSKTMAPSRNPWLGDMPADWKMERTKYCFEIRKRIIGHEGPDVLAVTNRGIQVKDLSSGKGQFARNYSNYQIVEPGDFIMNNLDLVTGWVDCSSLSGVTSPDYRVFRSRRDDLRNEYYRYLFQMLYLCRIYRDVSNVVEGVGWGRLQRRIFDNFLLPIPPIEDQLRIAKRIGQKMEALESFVNSKQSIIDDLKAYKQSLIYEVVTGKREV
jgi:type I restriction enzyme S subunit